MPPLLPSLPKTQVCQSRSIHFPYLSPPRPPPRHAHRSITVYNIITMQLFGYNALHIMAIYKTIYETIGDNLFTWVTLCPAKHKWCMHIVWIKCIPCFCRSLVAPSCSCAQITKSCSRVISIHLWCVYNEDESNEESQQIKKKNPVFPVLGFRLFSPVS